MTLLNHTEGMALAITITSFVILYLILHIKLIKPNALDKKFLRSLWKAIRHTSHGQHIKALGYKE